MANELFLTSDLVAEVPYTEPACLILLSTRASSLVFSSSV